MQRYKFCIASGGLIEDENGPYVRQIDAQSEIDSLNDEIINLRDSLIDLRAEYRAVQDELWRDRN